MPGATAAAGAAGKKKKSKKQKEEHLVACPECGSEILDNSKGPEIIRCIVCKHVFEIETEESKLRKGKEVPHRIRNLSRFSTLFKKPAEDEEGEEEERHGKELKAVRSKEEIKKLKVIGISMAVMFIFIILALVDMSVDLGIVLTESTKEIELENEEVVEEKFQVKMDWLAFIMIGMMCGFGPIGIYEGRYNNKITRLEERLADFLRDLAEASRSGQTLHEAIITASGGEYGELLPEIKRMAVQISWGVSSTEALDRFADRVRTPLVKRAVTLINEASSAGGDVSKVLEAAANDTKEIQMLQRERKIQMSLYVAVIFISFVVFLVVILIVYATFVPEMKKLAMQQDDGSEDDSGTEATGMAFSPAGVDFDEIKMLFIAAALVHAVGDGLVAGLMGSGKMTDGLKLSFIMILIVFIIFILLMPAVAVG
jgi:flagellar protein FlaJ